MAAVCGRRGERLPTRRRLTMRAFSAFLHGPLLVSVTGFNLGCRDATLPFEAVDRVDESASLPRQLTFSGGDDRSPAWSGDGERILYAAEGFPPFAATRGLLLQVPAAGGPSAEVLPLLQVPGGPAGWFASPVETRDARVAWMDLFGVRDENLCPQTVIQCMPGGSDGVAPRLTELRLRVLRPDQVSGPQDPLLVVPVAGVDPLPPQGGGSGFQVENHPFQQVFHAESSAVFRPAWDPAQERLAFSDGLRILIWRPGDGQAQSVPNTDDGVQAAWSPDGEWLAFTLLVRGPPQTFECEHLTPLGPVCTQERVDYAILDRVVMVVRPDGSGLREVGPGDDPAWWPGTGRLVFRRDGQLWSAMPDGSEAEPLEGTEGGREPAVSPDGTQIAFARLDPTVMTHNLWLVASGEVQ